MEIEIEGLNLKNLKSTGTVGGIFKSGIKYCWNLLRLVGASQVHSSA